MIFNDRIKELRQTRNLTQKQVSELSKVPYRTYQDLEVYTNFPKCDTLIKLALFFEVSTDYLLGLKDNLN